MRANISSTASAMLLICLACALVAGETGLERPTRPGPFQNVGLGGGGGMFAPSSSPHDPLVMFVNCDMSGLYRSQDGGKSWKIVDFRQACSNTLCRVVFDPKDPNVVYHNGKVSRDQGITWQPLCAKPPYSAVTEMAADPADELLLLLGANEGAYLSRDTGANWEKCPAVTGKVARFYIDPATPKGNRRLFVATNSGLWRSDDGGKSFQDKTAGLPTKEFRDLAGGRSNDGSKIALYCTSKSGVYKSEDMGDSWQSAMGQGINKNSAAQYYLLGAAEGKPERVYVTCTGSDFQPPNHETVFRSDDGGKSWQPVLYRDFRYKECNLENGWIIYSLSSGWGGFHTKEDGFFVNPKHPDTLMWTDFGECNISLDGGKNWRGAFTQYVPGQPPPTREKPGRWRSIGLEVTTAWQYLIDPHNHKRHYICQTDIGLLISEDRGDTWFNNSGTSGTPWVNTTYGLAFDPEVPDLVWAAQSSKHDIYGWFDAKGPGGVCISTDGGYHWKKSSQGLPDAPCRSIVVDPKSPKDARVLYVTMYGEGVFKSTDGGKTWAKKSEGIDLARSNHVLYVKLHSDGTLFCAVSGMGRDWRSGAATGAVYRSKNGADAWECISTPLKLHWSTDIAADPRDSNVVYWNAISLAQISEGGVYKTTDGGKSWNRLMKDEDVVGKGGANYLHATMLDIDPRNPDLVYLGTATNGPWYSPDAGKTWKPFTDVPFSVINHTTVDPDDPEFIYIATYGAAVWRGLLPTAKPRANGTPAVATTKAEPKKPVAPPPPAIKPEALAPWHQKLIDRAIVAGKGDAKPEVYLTLFGQKEQKVKFLGADAQTLSVEVLGNTMPLAWGKLTGNDRLNLALAFCNDKSAEDHVLVAVLALAVGRGELSEERFAKAVIADPNSRQLVEQTKQALQ